jgi:purine-binding chemotaxis protein CheW
LAFNVSGLKLAVPVQFVDSMQPLDLISVATSSSETSLSKGEASSSNPLILGQMKVDRGEDAQPFCAVLDTARLVMPERYDNGMQESYRYILTLKNCDWSIAVDSIGGEIGLTPQNVRWRSEHTRREWLAGTVVDKMCALIDIDLLNRQMMADAILMESDE